MLKALDPKRTEPIHLKTYEWSVALFWTALIGVALVWGIRTEAEKTRAAALIEARTALQKDVAYRSWMSRHNSVFITITENTQPSPYLAKERRDFITPWGEKLTRINPAYMTRQVHELEMNDKGVKGHLTSLKPIRPGNVPDEWERQALIAFQAGEKEQNAIREVGGEKWMRLIVPLYTEQSCLNCHAEQGYRVGDLRGGISATVPMAPLEKLEQSRRTFLALVLILIWGVGLFGNRLGMHLLGVQLQRRRKAEKALRGHEKLQGVIEMAGAVCHEMNQPLQIVSGYCELLKAKLGEDHTTQPTIENIMLQTYKMRDITAKLMNITQYKTKDYLNGKIIDIDAATD